MNRLYYKIITPDRKGYWQPVYCILGAVSILYKSVLAIRRWCYRSGLFRTRRLDCRVISVGNLTLGGTGKTPMVMMIADILRRHGRKPAILSRGYKGNASRQVSVVCDGERILLSAEAAGDEPVMMARRLKTVPVLTGSNRYLAGLHAIERLGADTLILDDGFQHLRLHRDLNILLVDHQRPFGTGGVFPAGDLREPACEIRRADLLCITRHTAGDGNPSLEAGLDGDIPILKTTVRPRSVVRLDTGELLAPEQLRNQNVAAFCGIARPEDFRRVLDQLQARVVLYRAFPDHHAYSPQDLKSIEQDALQAGARFILTTAKDAVKLKTAAFAVPVLQVVIDLEIVEGEEVFNRYILNRAGVSLSD
ncbi:MAG: tetraacyldisaccharide 4'-kinase [Nitrospinales bacterium]